MNTIKNILTNIFNKPVIFTVQNYDFDLLAEPVATEGQ